MPRAVQFGRYGDVDVLYIAEVPVPEAEDRQVVVRVRSDTITPAHFPDGEGTEFAGTVHWG